MIWYNKTHFVIVLHKNGHYICTSFAASSCNTWRRLSPRFVYFLQKKLIAMRMHCSMQLNIDSLLGTTIYQQHANNFYSKYAYQHIIDNHNIANLNKLELQNIES